MLMTTPICRQCLASILVCSLSRCGVVRQELCKVSVLLYKLPILQQHFANFILTGTLVYMCICFPLCIFIYIVLEARYYPRLDCNIHVQHLLCVIKSRKNCRRQITSLYCVIKYSVMQQIIYTKNNASTQCVSLSANLTNICILLQWISYLRTFLSYVCLTVCATWTHRLVDYNSNITMLHIKQYQNGFYVRNCIAFVLLSWPAWPSCTPIKKTEEQLNAVGQRQKDIKKNSSREPEGH